MARPRKDFAGPSARERIFDAFWDLLGQMPFEAITVSALVKRAKVSPNTLYYHFGGYDEVVRAALDDILDPKLLPVLVAGVQQMGDVSEEDVLRRMRRIVLFASDGSGKLSAMLQEALLATWLQALGLSRGDLTPVEDAELEFIFAGVATVLSRQSAEDMAGNRALMEGFFQRPLGQGLLATIAALRGRARSDSHA